MRFINANRKLIFYVRRRHHFNMKEVLVIYIELKAGLVDDKNKRRGFREI
ncbi:hypothetical protein [Bacillus sp. 491mf]|nr:hypothetical protein [Bacillus sp. 491mf]